MNKLVAKLGGVLEILSCNDGFIVRERPILENHPDFNKFKDLSNLYKVDLNFQPVWEAELPRKGDQYHGTLVLENGMLKTFSGDFLCFIDLKTGKLISKHDAK